MSQYSNIPSQVFKDYTQMFLIKKILAPFSFMEYVLHKMHNKGGGI